MNRFTITEYLCHKWLHICSVCRNHNPFRSHSWLIIGPVTIVTWRVPGIVEQELVSVRSTWVHSWFLACDMNVTWSLAFCVMFWRSLFDLLTFSFWPLCCLSFDLRLLITLGTYPHKAPCFFFLLSVTFFYIIFLSNFNAACLAEKKQIPILYS